MSSVPWPGLGPSHCHWKSWSLAFSRAVHSPWCQKQSTGHREDPEKQELLDTHTGSQVATITDGSVCLVAFCLMSCQCVWCLVWPKLCSGSFSGPGDGLVEWLVGKQGGPRMPPCACEIAALGGAVSLSVGFLKHVRPLGRVHSLPPPRISRALSGPRCVTCHCSYSHWPSPPPVCRTLHFSVKTHQVLFARVLGTLCPVFTHQTPSHRQELPDCVAHGTNGVYMYPVCLRRPFFSLPLCLSLSSATQL